jgi:CheY-like chemotaxis protein
MSALPAPYLPSNAGISNRKILVIDDARVMRKKLAYVLEKVGYHVFTAENGLEGLQLVAKENPDLIVMDLHMPVMDGFEVHRRIRRSKSYAHIPIIFLTASSGFHIAQIGEALSHGVNEFMTKPFKVDKLLAKIIELLPKNSRPHTANRNVEQ